MRRKRTTTGMAVASTMLSMDIASDLYSSINFSNVGEMSEVSGLAREIQFIQERLQKIWQLTIFNVFQMKNGCKGKRQILLELQDPDSGNASDEQGISSPGPVGASDLSKEVG